MEFFDTHSHYNDEKFDADREKIIEKTKEDGITRFNCVGYDIPSSKLSVQIANKYNFIYSICGVSPNDVVENENQVQAQVNQIEELLKENESHKIVAVGEIGLDYHWNSQNKEIQKETFKRQIELANKYELPIVIHTREAVYDTLEILKQNEVIKKGIFHCCPLNRELVKEGLKLGFYISFAGPITFKNSKNAKEVVKLVPINRILIETDSPYLAPEPKRGTRNDSRNVKIVAQKIADFKKLTLQEVAAATYNNALKIFEINAEK